MINILLQEDLYNGSSIADVLVRHGSMSADLLTLAVCLVANLAVDEVSQVEIHIHLPGTCTYVNDVCYLMLMSHWVVCFC